jgi:hypothetical protein
MTALRAEQFTTVGLLDRAAIEQRVRAGDIVALLAEIEAGRYGDKDTAMEMLEEFVVRDHGPGVIGHIRRMFFSRR